jgi:hypothetical protein
MSLAAPSDARRVGRYYFGRVSMRRLTGLPLTDPDATATAAAS